MESTPYLLHLTARLADGLCQLPVEQRARHAEYLLSSQNPDGGYSGREGGSDLYYTGFGLRGLAVLDSLSPGVSERAGLYLRGCLTRQASVIDLFSLLYSCLLVQAGGGPDVLSNSPADWPERVVETLETFRREDGGYAKAAEAVSGSTYHTFLVGLCYQLLGKPVPRAKEIANFLETRSRDDGGFVEIAPMRRGGTNPTAAAIGLLQIVDSEVQPAVAISEKTKQGAIDFLVAMASAEGGLRANGRAPLADLLSTFTGMWTLDQLHALDRIDTPAVLRYVRALELTAGGFHGGLWDEGTDVEYTFYGLGCLAILKPLGFFP